MGNALLWGACGTGAALAPQASPPSASHGCTCPAPPGAGWSQTSAMGGWRRRERGDCVCKSRGEHAAPFRTFPGAGACRDGEFWTGRVCMGEKCSVPFGTALSDSFPFWHFNIRTDFLTSRAFAFNMHRISVLFCFQFAACFS